MRLKRYPCPRPGGLAGLTVPAILLAALQPAVALARSAEPLEELTVLEERPFPSGDDASVGRVVFSRADIEMMNPLSAAQLLDAAPGLYVNQAGGSGGIASVHIRGAEPNFTLIMVDGVRVNDPTDARGGTFDLMRLNVSNIERVEVIKGPLAALYYQDSLAGVVNIVTRAPSHEPINLFAESGSDNSFRTAASVTQPFGQGHSIRLSAGYQNLGTAVEGSRAEGLFAQGGLDLRLGASSALTFTGIYHDGIRRNFPDDSGGPQLAVFRDTDRTDASDITLVTRYRHQFSQTSRIAASISWYRLDRSETSPGIYPGTFVPPNGGQTQFERLDLDMRAEYAPAESASLTLGGSYSHESGDSAGYLISPDAFPVPFSLSRDTAAGFANLQLQPIDAVTLMAGVRASDWTGLKAQASPFAGFEIAIGSSGAALRVHWGEAVKPPSFYALAHPLIGNANLRPERAELLEAGLTLPLGSMVEATLTAFSNHYRDLIDFDAESFALVNRSAVSSDGAEGQLRFSPAEGFKLSTTVTYSRTRIEGLGQRLRGRPDWQTQFEARWQATDALSLLVAGRQVSSQFATSQVTGAAILSGYFKLDARARYAFSRSTSLTLSGDNLTDNRAPVAVGFPSPGLAVRVGVQTSF